MNDTIVVCGGTGFLGRALIEDLKRKGHTRIRSISRSIDRHLNIDWKEFHDQRNEERDGVMYQSADLTNEGQAIGALRDARFVYNLAATVVGGIDYIHQNRANAMRSAQINLNLLNACQKVGVQRYFYASSACVYSSHDWAIGENRTEPPNPERGYGWEKLFGEQVCREFREAGYVETRAARLFTLYGPGDDKKHNHFPAEICRKVAMAKRLSHKSIDVWGDGNQVRSLLYIDDAVEGIQRIMNSGVTIPLNLSSATPATVRKMVEIVQGIAGTELQVNYGGGTVGVESRYSDNTAIKRELSWEPSTTLEDGFRKTWGWWWDKTLKEIKLQ